MRTYALPLTAVLVLVSTCASQAAEKPRAAQPDRTQPDRTQPAKVWTNDDLAQLRAQGLISIVGQEATAPAAKSSAPAEPAFPVYASRLDDPTWYADQAAALQAELEKRQAALQEQQEAIAQAANRITDPGVALNRGDAGVTPAQGVANLQARVEEVQSQLDALSDLARQHDIPPGDLRG